MHLPFGCAHLARSILLVGAVLGLGACSASTIAACSAQPDVSGAWTLTLSPEPASAGVTGPTIPGDIEIDANLVQGRATDILGIGHFVYGTLVASDPSYFATLTIPQLSNNDGSKTGAVLGCKININVPIAMPVTDDDVDQGPLRIALVGDIDMAGHIAGDVGSTLIMSGDSSATVRSFAWSGTKN